METIREEAAFAARDPVRFPVFEGFLNSCLYSQSNRRIGYRISLGPLKPEISGRFRVLVGTGHGQQTVIPIDLSLTDMCVESERVIAEHGAEIDVILSYEETQVELSAIAVRQSSRHAQTAFVFLDVLKDGEPEPPANLDFIFRQLEALENRVRYKRLTCLAASSACSILAVVWMVF